MSVHKYLGCQVSSCQVQLQGSQPAQGVAPASLARRKFPPGRGLRPCGSIITMQPSRTPPTQASILQLPLPFQAQHHSSHARKTSTPERSVACASSAGALPADGGAGEAAESGSTFVQTVFNVVRMLFFNSI